MGKIIILPLAIILLFFAFIYTQGRLEAISEALSTKTGVALPKMTQRSGCDEECKKIIAEEVAKAVATISGRPKTQVTISSSGKPQTIYIPLDGTGATTKTDWVDAPGIEVAFDLAKDYSAGASVSWEASLKVANGNGQAYARLFDVTHGIAVSGSEISTTNNADYKRTNSGNLNLWAGRNIYRVQIKSLNSFEVSYTGGKIRISY